MKVTIIGAGLMGPGIGTRLAAGGNDVKLIDTDPEQAQTLAGELSGHGGVHGAAADGDRGSDVERVRAHQHDVGRLGGNVGASADREPDVGLGACRGAPRRGAGHRRAVATTTP